MATANIPCTLAKGFFDTELYVNVGSSSAVVDRRTLSVLSEPTGSAEGKGYVEVFIVEAQGAQTLIELPGEPVFGSLRTWIQSAALQRTASEE